MRRTSLVIAVGAVAVVAAIVLAPATLLQSRVAAITGGAVRIEGATGTVWHGTGTLVGGDSRLPVAWRIAPWSLLTGGLELKLGADERASTTPLRGDLTLDSGHLSLRDVEVVLPIAAVTSMARVPGGWIAGGDLHVHALAFDWAPPAIHPPGTRAIDVTAAIGRTTSTSRSDR